MDIQSSVNFIMALLEYVLPAAFLFVLTDLAVRIVIRAATGKIREGLFD